MKIPSEFYVYSLLDPRNMKVFYIGKGKKASKGRIERYLAHMHCALKENDLQNKRKYRILRKLISLNLTPVYVFNCFSNEEKVVLQKEIELIKNTPDLCNISPGGIGGKIYKVHPALGKKFSLEWRTKLSIAKKGKPSNRKGSKITEETREKIRNNRKKQTGLNEPRLAHLNQDQIENVIKLRLLGFGRRKIEKHTGIGAGIVKRIVKQHLNVTC